MRDSFGRNVTGARRYHLLIFQSTAVGVKVFEFFVILL